jgi:3alpha(or 20beta)-hydroxysteroid dehydrogenase
MTGRHEGTVAIVTGGARGLGAAQVRRLVDEGARVLVADVLEDEGSALADELGDVTRFHRLDVTSRDGWAAAVERAEEAFGPVTALSNNAGIVLWHGLLDASEEDYRKVIDVNQVGVFLGMQAVVPSMQRAGGGAIVNLSSTAGVQGFPSIFSYVASKWAVRGMTKAAALELAGDGIRVNSVHPGSIETPMTEGLDEDGEASAAIPLKRFGRPEEVAALIAYLLSAEASYTTGTEHVIDGGVTVG